MKENSWAVARWVGDYVIAVCDAMTFGKGRLTIGQDYSGYERAYWYETAEGAVRAYEKWNPEVDADPDGWFRCPTDGRRRPDGDASKEHIDW